MKIKKTLVFITALCMIMSAGCSTNSTAKTTENNTSSETGAANSDGSYVASETNVKRLGRTYFDDSNTLWCALSGSGVEFSFTGTKAELTLVGDSNTALTNKDGNPRFAIYIDGERVMDEMLDSSEKTYTIADYAATKTSVVKIIKLSEAANSTFGIKSIKVDTQGEIKPVENKDMLIEFIGDSITCGYGVDDEVKEHHFSTTTEDITKTYAYKTAETLNADYSMVSYSGYGIVSGYSANGQKVAAQTIPQYYDKAGFSYGNMNGVQISSIDWDFSKREPDIIVINLGTNDDTYCKDDAKKEEYSAAYVEFLKQIREKNPNAKIMCTLGIMGGNLYPYIELAVYNYTEETSDKNVASMMFESQSMDDGIAADWHPSETTHGKASEKLVNELKTLGWVTE